VIAALREETTCGTAVNSPRVQELFQQWESLLDDLNQGDATLTHEWDTAMRSLDRIGRLFSAATPHSVGMGGERQAGYVSERGVRTRSSSARNWRRSIRAVQQCER
jgi:hypothetical protein